MQVNVGLLVAAVASCTVNGKSLSLPKPTSTTATSSTTASTSASPTTSPTTCAAQHWSDPWPYLDRPADPWLAVHDGQPVRVQLPTDSMSGIPQNPTGLCDAAHDHCLRDCTWLVTDPSDGHRLATPYHVDGSGAFVEEDWRSRGRSSPEGFVAYRTVPVTRSNVRVGGLAMAFDGPVFDGHDASTQVTGFPRNLYGWNVGTVKSIDWDGGVVWLQGYPEAYFLAATRVPVLRYTAGGTVEALPGIEAKAPAVADVIAPGRVAKTSDPWSQVGKDHRPIAVDDSHTISALEEPCPAKVDHCLRPWVWFVDVGGSPVAARWSGKTFVPATNPDGVIDHPGLAYRTRPAKESELRPGLRILFYGNVFGSPASPRAAHEMRGDWDFGVVDTIDANFHTFTVRGSDTGYPVDNARLLVLYWLPGEDAAAVE